MKKFLFSFEAIEGTYTYCIEETCIERARKAAKWFYGEPLEIREASDAEVEKWSSGLCEFEREVQANLNSAMDFVRYMENEEE